MIENIKLENFRGFKEIELTDLRRISLISGKNNSGKSSVLEGVFLFLDHLAPESFIKINGFRGLPGMTSPTNMWASAFYNLDVDQTIKIAIQCDGKQSTLQYSKDDSFILPHDAELSAEVRNQFVSGSKSSYSLKFRFEEEDYIEEGHFVTASPGVGRNMKTNKADNQIEPMVHTQFINSEIAGNDGTLAEWFGRLELEGKKRQVIEALQLIDPAVSDITTIVMNGSIQLYVKKAADNGAKLLPLKLAGDGLNRLLYFLLCILENPDSVILIDEIETGFHYSMYSMLWKTLSLAAKQNGCQIIATTHSYECIMGAVTGISEAKLEDEFCYYRIEQKAGKGRAFWFSEELLRTAAGSDMEVR